MPGILDILSEQFGDAQIDQIASRLGADRSKTKDAISMSLPALIEAMGRQAERPGGLQQMHSQITSQEAYGSGSMLDSLNQILDSEGDSNRGNPTSLGRSIPGNSHIPTPLPKSVDPRIASEAHANPSAGQTSGLPGGLESIFGELMGSKRERVGEAVSKSSGLGKSQAGALISMLGPMIIGMLAKQANTKGLNPGDLDGMLKSDRSKIQQSASGGILAKLFDQDGDGDFDLSDVLKLASGFLRR